MTIILKFHHVIDQTYFTTATALLVRLFRVRARLQVSLRPKLREADARFVHGPDRPSGTGVDRSEQREKRRKCDFPGRQIGVRPSMPDESVQVQYRHEARLRRTHSPIRIRLRKRVSMLYANDAIIILIFF